MKHRLHRALLLSLFTLHTSLFLPAKPGEQFPPLTPQETSAIFAAAPEDARAKPQRPRKLLVFYRTEGFVHKSIPNANHALKLMGELTGAYTVTLSDDMAQFEPAALAAYDAVVFNNTSRLKFENPVHRRALLDFVRNGKGMIGIHAGSDNFPTWTEGQALMGGVFHSHPWVARDTVAVKNDDPGHILNTAFEKRGFWITEEIYQHVGPYSREKQRVLLSLDMSREENKRPANKIVRDDNDFGISWLKTEGKGRVFYTSLGHNKNIFEVPQILQHLLDGIQYALGDLEADAVPSAKLKTQPKPALAPDIKIPLQTLTVLPSLKSLAAYEVGDPLGPQLTYEKFIRTQNAEQRAAIETELTELIAAPQTTTDAKRVFLNWLGWIGTEKSIPTLTAVAKNPDLAHAAISALATINAPNADDTLLVIARDGFISEPLPASTRIEALNAIGQRRDEKQKGLFTQSLGALAKDKDPAVAEAAREVLARIAPSATLVGQGELLPMDENNALLYSADSFVPKDVARFLKHAADNPRISAAVACRMVTSGDVKVLEALERRLDDIPTGIQVRMMNALAANPVPIAAFPLINRLLASKNTEVRIAAIAAAGSCAYISSIEKLVALLSSEDKDIAAAAFTALTQIPDENGHVNLTIYEEWKGIAETNPLSKKRLSKLLLILAQRQEYGMFRFALADTASDDNDLRAAAFEAVALLVREGDFPQILELAANIKRPADRREWTKALYTSAAIHPVSAEAVSLIEKQLNAAKPADRPSLIAALTMIDAPEAKSVLHAMLTSPDIDARKETIRALSSARGETAYELLLERITAAPSESERLLAQRGAIDTVDHLAIPANDKVKAYRKLWKTAQTQEARDAIIAAVKNLGNSSAKRFLKEISQAEK
ncbi:ThuA domain-containing protein [Ereboglobus luteus]|uniref:ThuA-like domain-containing protein n=1 Tax=Ereboglobus luteus TaxID=1796921 RepID=A0A2U8DZ23_9BACT|nr:ThuA domain-containing protein [Ereboglobus luteus]AWI07887.1 hypothetical protein CKA38_00195 [Ereboglobus luteus]